MSDDPFREGRFDLKFILGQEEASCMELYSHYKCDSCMREVFEDIISLQHFDNCIGNDILVSIQPKNQTYHDNSSEPQTFDFFISLFSLAFLARWITLTGNFYSESVPIQSIFYQNQRSSTVDSAETLVIAHK